LLAEAQTLGEVGVLILRNKPTIMIRIVLTDQSGYKFRLINLN